MSPNPVAQILVVEDETNVGTTLVERLEREGYSVGWAKTAKEALAFLDKKPIHLALLDVGLPDSSGFDVATEIRKRSPATAIVFLTAFSNPEDRIKGLELGAEDYVVKPFHFKELLLRIQNGLRRANALKDTGQEPVRIGRGEVDFARFEVRVEGVSYSLTHKESRVLKLLLEAKERVVSRDEILNSAWSEDEFPTSRTVDNFILRLRKLLEPNVDEPTMIRSVRGVGYQLVLQDRQRKGKP